jgi:hypothetical protein
MDIPMPAGSDGGTRAAGAPWTTWVEDRRRIVIPVAFGVAILLGIVIGLVTATSPAGDDAGGAAAVTAPARQPPAPAISWDAGTAAGTGRNLALGDQSAIVRTALAWAVADDALAKAGKPTWSKVYLDAGSPAPGTANAQAATTRAALTDQAITIPQGLNYGAVRGADAAHDQLWAVGNVNPANPAVPTAAPVDHLYLWERIGSGPWTVVASGPTACAKIPPQMTAVWGASPKPCTS